MCGVELGEVCVDVRRTEIVDSNNPDLIAQTGPLVQRAQDVATDATIPINSYVDHMLLDLATSCQQQNVALLRMMVHQSLINANKMLLYYIVIAS